MLKKKQQLPPRPKPPNTDQIAEDLENAPANDVVFTLKPHAPAVVENEVEGSLTQEETQQLAQKWTEVEEFVHCNKQLQELLEKIQGQSEHLQASELELRGMADDIRRQALDALK